MSQEAYYPYVPQAAPVGGATAANQLTQITLETSIDGKLTNGTQKSQVINASGLAVDAFAFSTQVTSSSVGLVTHAVMHGLATAGGGNYVDVKVNPSGALTVDATISGTVPLPTGAATETTLSAINTKTPALGQALAAASVPVVLTAAQLTTLTPLSTVATTQSGAWNITNVSGTVSLPTGASTSALQTTGNSSLSSIDSKTPALGQALAAASVPVVLTAAQLTTLTPLSTVAATQSGTWNITNISGTVSLPTGASTSALQTTGNTSLSSIDTKTPTVGQKAMAASRPVVIASDQSNIPVSFGVATTSTVTSVASSATSVSLLTSNASRKGAYVYNDSTSILYLKLGTTASTTSYTVQIGPGGYWEMPNPTVYSGVIDGIWSSANGSARLTELT